MHAGRGALCLTARWPVMLPMLPPSLAHRPLGPCLRTQQQLLAKLPALKHKMHRHALRQSTLNIPAAQGPGHTERLQAQTQGAQATRQRARGKAAASRAGQVHFAQEKQEPDVHALIQERRLAAQKLTPTDIVYGLPGRDRWP